MAHLAHRIANCLTQCQHLDPLSRYLSPLVPWQPWLETLNRFAEARQVVCRDWEHLDDRMALVRRANAEAITQDFTPIAPFLAMSLPFAPEEILSICRAHARISQRIAKEEREQAPQFLSLSFPHPTPIRGQGVDLQGPRRMRVVYLAAHFHPSKLMNGFLKGVWSLHDRRKMEVHTFAWDQDPQMRNPDGTAPQHSNPSTPRWISTQVENFVDAQGKSDLEIALQINKLEPDVLIEMVGWYPEHRSGIVAHRPARTQALYRFIGSGGGRGDDFYFSDSVSQPPELKHLVDERIVYLQPLYLACSHKSSFPRPKDWATQGINHRRVASRQEWGLRPDGRLLGALNKPYKFTPHSFDVWCKLLKSLPDALLVVIRYKHYPESSENLVAEALKRQISADRIKVVKEGNHSAYLRLGTAMDLFLDSSAPLSNGHTTVVDMLWGEVPVLTTPGPAKPSRVAASILLAAGSAVTLARNLEDYASLGSAFLRRGSQSVLSNPQVENLKVFDAAFFAERWLRSLGLMAQGDFGHIIVPESRG
mmetsp:Transcript_12725/g.20023  ORF Transcript_12725/g.20023 Transcript_12725/m.20023 type:complete len:535 (+) Transcript_12725:16-1620(+)